MNDPTTVTVMAPLNQEEEEAFWSVEVIEQPEGDWMVTEFHGVCSEERAREYAKFLAEKYGVTVEVDE